jgi:hypothetical protein
VWIDDAAVALDPIALSVVTEAIFAARRSRATRIARKAACPEVSHARIRRCVRLRPDALRSGRGLADSRSIVATGKVVENAQTLALLSIAHLKPPAHGTARHCGPAHAHDERNNALHG